MGRSRKKKVLSSLSPRLCFRCWGHGIEEVFNWYHRRYCRYLSCPCSGCTWATVDYHRTKYNACSHCRQSLWNCSCEEERSSHPYGRNQSNKGGSITVTHFYCASCGKKVQQCECRAVKKCSNLTIADTVKGNIEEPPDMPRNKLRFDGTILTEPQSDNITVSDVGPIGINSAEPSKSESDGTSFEAAGDAQTTSSSSAVSESSLDISCDCSVDADRRFQPTGRSSSAKQTAPPGSASVDMGPDDDEALSLESGEKSKLAVRFPSAECGYRRKKHNSQSASGTTHVRNDDDQISSRHPLPSLQDPKEVMGVLECLLTCVEDTLTKTVTIDRTVASQIEGPPETGDKTSSADRGADVSAASGMQERVIKKIEPSSEACSEKNSSVSSKTRSKKPDELIRLRFPERGNDSKSAADEAVIHSKEDERLLPLDRVIYLFSMVKDVLLLQSH